MRPVSKYLDCIYVVFHTSAYIGIPKGLCFVDPYQARWKIMSIGII